MDETNLLQFNPAKHAITPIVLSPSATIIGATTLVHSVIPDFTKFEFHKNKFLVTEHGMLLLYKDDKVIYPLMMYMIQPNEYILCRKFEIDWLSQKELPAQ